MKKSANDDGTSQKAIEFWIDVGYFGVSIYRNVWEWQEQKYEKEKLLLLLLLLRCVYIPASCVKNMFFLCEKRIIVVSVVVATFFVHFKSLLWVCIVYAHEL